MRIQSASTLPRRRETSGRISDSVFTRGRTLGRSQPITARTRYAGARRLAARALALPRSRRMPRWGRSRTQVIWSAADALARRLSSVGPGGRWRAPPGRSSASLVWPLQEGFAARSLPGRALAAGPAAVLLAGVGPPGPSSPTTAPATSRPPRRGSSCPPLRRSRRWRRRSPPSGCRPPTSCRERAPSFGPEADGAADR